MIPYGRQSIDEDDIQSVVDVLRSDFLTQGPVVANFEDAVAQKCSVQYALSFSSATSALHAACSALGVVSGDEVWVPAISFVASANCALYCGAKVDFLDVDSTTFNIDLVALSNKLEIAAKNSALPKLVIAVHMCGSSCDMKVLKDLSSRFGFLILEDASHAIGAQYSGGYVGDCVYSDATVFSFHPVKIITTGEGGMITTNSKILFERLSLLRSHGITRDKSLHKLRDNGGGDWYYEQQLLGYNYRLTDIQCALGLSQLRKLDQFVDRRNYLASQYNILLKGLPIFTQSLLPRSKSSYHLYVILLDIDKIDKSRDVIFNELRLNGVGVNLHYMPIYRQPFYKKFGFNKVNYPGAEFYFERCITLPLYPGLPDEAVKTVTNSLRSAIGS